jgi:hypothetical protein
VLGKTIYYPEVAITHIHAKESYKSVRMLFEHIKSAVKYFNKWGWFFDEERTEINNTVLRELWSEKPGYSLDFGAARSIMKLRNQYGKSGI